MGDTLITVLPKQVVLYKRERSSVWQCRYKLEDKRWRRKSTGETDSVKAGKAALRIYYEGEVKREHKLPINNKRFGGIADAVVKQMEGAKYFKMSYKYIVETLDPITVRFDDLYVTFR